MQYQGNVELWKSLANPSAEKDFCNGLETSIVARAAGFMRLHPDLFAPKTAEKIEKDQTLENAVSRKLESYSQLRKLYVFRVVENRVGDDAKMMLKDPENGSDNYHWAIKVISIEYGFLGQAIKVDFPDIGAIYNERMELYGKYVRREFNQAGLQIAEQGNEKSKDEIYACYLASELRSQSQCSKK